MRVVPPLASSLSVGLLLASLMGLLAGCPPPTVDGEPDAGNINLGDAGPLGPPADGGFDDAGEPINPDAGPVNTVVTVTSVTQPSGALAGGYRVRIDGDGFTADTRFFFDGVEGDLTLPIQLPRAMSVRVPPGTQPGPVTVRALNDLGIGELIGGFTYFSPITLDSVTPDHGSTEGGTPVTLEGVGLTDAMIVTVDGRQVVDLVVDESGTSATFFSPPGQVGRADVTGIDAFGRGVLELAFTYDAPLRLERVTPDIVDDNGAVVELGGTGFSDEGADTSSVTIGAATAARNNLISDSRLRVVVPAGLVGAQDVTVSRGSATSTRVGALIVRPAPTGAFLLTAAVPARADVDGGTAVTLVGEGLTSTTGVTVGGTTATNVVVVDDRTVTFTAPIGAAVGAVSVDLTRADLSVASLPFAYFQPVAVDDVAPPFGPTAGGTAITITGRGFADPATVLLGGMPASDVVVVGPTQITATAPAGASGPVDVVVEAGGERGVLVGGFRYDAALSVVGVRPSRGALGGDTFVTITGTGFTRGTPSVAFGGTPALPLDVTVVNDSTITCRTPPHQPELIDVVITSGAGPTAQSATAEKVYTYFDPTSIVGGTRGGVIDGAVYITALDANLGLPIPGLIAYVGTDGTPVASGITNVLGQATISGPDVRGPQTVTILGDCFSSATFVDVNAAELTVFLFATCGAPPNPGPGPEPPPPATIRGRVFGFAKEFFDPAALDQSGCVTGPPAKCEIAFAEVRTTSRDEFSGTPPAGGDNVVFEEGGEYFIANSRPGRLAVVALAGIYDLNNDTFRLRQMGVRREVFPQFGVNLEDQDIELTIPLDTEIDLSLPDAPLRFDDAQIGFRPTITRVVPFVQFGGEGAFNYTQAVEGKRNHVLEEMPEVPGEMLTFISGAYTTDGENLTASAGTAVFVQGSTVVTGVGTFEWADTDFNGTPLVVGGIIVTDRPNGSRFASIIKGCAPGADPVSQPCVALQLQDPPDFSSSVSGQSYHIGDPGPPSSEVIQDGVGDMRGGITIQPVLGLPEILSPLDNGVLTDRTLRWKAAPGQQPTIHDMFVYEAFDFETIWEIYVDGSRTKVILPVVPTTEDILASLPTAQRLCLADPEINDLCAFYGDLSKYVPPKDMARGGVTWLHEAVFSPGLDFNNWSLLEIGLRGRRAWTTDEHSFIHGTD